LPTSKIANFYSFSAEAADAQIFAAFTNDSSIDNHLPENILLRMARKAEEESAHLCDGIEIR
jgi:hypothetical protein